jgi:tetratricopeptide (TPR) repeat protein
MKLSFVWLILGTISLNAASESIAIDRQADWADTGRSRFFECRFTDAARAFTKALQLQPDDAGLHLWLGKSYARMAEVAGPLHVAGNARQARRNLERAVELEPRNREYLRELFDFYLDSPEYFGGGLGRAALLVERIAPDDPGVQAFLRGLLDGARQEYHSLDWRLRQATLVPSAQIGRIVS